MDSLTDSRSIRALVLQTPHKRCFAPTAVGNCCQTRYFASTVAPDVRNRLGLNRIMQNKRYSVLVAAGSFRRMRISAVPAVQSALQIKQVGIQCTAAISTYKIMGLILDYEENPVE